MTTLQKSLQPPSKSKEMNEFTLGAKANEKIRKRLKNVTVVLIAMKMFDNHIKSDDFMEYGPEHIDNLDCCHFSGDAVNPKQL